MHRPRVDFPHPLSPTRPTVSPRRISKLTPSTALTWPLILCRIPSRIGKCFVRSRTVRTFVPASGSRRRAAAPTVIGDPRSACPSDPPRAHVGRRIRSTPPSAIPCSSSRGSIRTQTGAACGHRPANRQPGSGSIELRDRSLDRDQAAPAVRRRWDGADQSTGVRVERRPEDPIGRTRLHELAGVHHGRPGTDPADERQIVADVQHGHVVALLQFREQIHDAGLDRDVEGGGRLVGDQELRIRRQCLGDHDALLHAARQLVRVARHHLPGVGDAGVGERLRDPIVDDRLQAPVPATERWTAKQPSLGCPRPVSGVPAQQQARVIGVQARLPEEVIRPMLGEDLRHLLADRQARVESLPWVLEDHRDVIASDRSHPPFGGGQQIDRLLPGVGRTLRSPLLRTRGIANSAAPRRRTCCIRPLGMRRTSTSDGTTLRRPRSRREAGGSAGATSEP